VASRLENRQNGSDISKLTAMQQRFVLEMLADPSYNATEAARRAGYSSPNKACGNLMRVPAIKRYLGKAKRLREEETQLRSEDIWRQLHRAIFFDPAEVFESAGRGWWVLKSLEDIPIEVRQLIEEIRITTRQVTVPIRDAGTGHITGTKVVDMPLPQLKFVSKSGSLATAAKHAIPQEVKVSIDYDAMYRCNRDEPNEIEGEILRIERGEV